MQDIENSLKRAMSAMRRTSKKKIKRESSLQNGESFSEIIENIATERAEEELYRERYRRSLEATEGDSEALDLPSDSAPEIDIPTAQGEEVAVEPTPTETIEEIIPEQTDAPEQATDDTTTDAPAIEEIPIIDEPLEESGPIIEEIATEEIPSEEEQPEPAIQNEQHPSENTPTESSSEAPLESDGGAPEPSGNYSGQAPIGYYIVPGMTAVYPACTGYGMPAPMPTYIPGGEQITGGVSTFTPPMAEPQPIAEPEYPPVSDYDGYIPADLSGGEGSELPIDSYQPDGEVNMPTGDNGYVGDIDYGDNPPEGVDYGAPEIEALPPENIDYGAPDIEALPPENIDYGAPDIEALPPESVDYGAYNDPYHGDEDVELPTHLGGYPDELMYPTMTDISEGVHATDEGALHFIADRVDENVKLVEMRMLYEIAEYKQKHKISALSFSLEFGREYRNERELYREVNRRMNKMRRAIRLERDNNRRYYLVLADRCIADPVRREKNRARIESLIRRMDFLLTERHKINNRLMELYTGDSAEDKKPLAEKIGKKATRVAKRVYRSMKKLAKRVRRMRAPDELREKIFELMNERITTYSRRAQLEESLRRLKPRGEARRKMKREYRECCKRIRYINSDLKDFVKKAERYDTVYYENGKQLAWIFGTLVVLGALCGLYLLNKEAIDAFIQGLFGGV